MALTSETHIDFNDFILLLSLYDFELEIACPLFWDVLAEE